MCIFVYTVTAVPVINLWYKLIQKCFQVFSGFAGTKDVFTIFLMLSLSDVSTLLIMFPDFAQSVIFSHILFVNRWKLNYCA